MIWIGLFIYVLVWMVLIIGFIFGILNVIMSMIVLVVGSSGLDVILSLIVV